MQTESSVILDLYPDWYKLERETKDTINKLFNIKDLSFYLKSSDENIRRLAILRINELKLKDSIELLREIIDDPYEHPGNKELAAWTIKAVSQKWNIDLFISHKLLSKYSGIEKLDEIIKISISDSTAPISYKFTSNMVDRELHLNNTGIRQYDDVCFEADFSIKEWLIAYMSCFRDSIIKSITGIPLLLSKFVRNSVRLNVKKLFSSIRNLPKFSTSPLFQGFKHKRLNRKNFYMPPAKSGLASSFLKKIVVTFLYVLFSPVRVAIKHKFLLISAFLACYCLLTLTLPGKILIYKYTGMDFSEIQRSAYYSTKDFVSYAWSEAKSVIGIEPADTMDSAEQDYPPEQGILEKYKVSASEGLNLRSAPNGTSPKVVKDPLKYNTVVSFSGERKKDSSGRLWYFVTTLEGCSGWVNSKWLREAGRN